MTIDLSRRSLLASGAVFGLAATAQPARAQSPRRLVAERRVLDIDGKSVSVFGLRQSDGTAGLTLEPGERFTGDLLNKTNEDTIVHWHGQTPPNVQDGVAETGSPLIPPGGTQNYDFAARAGTHWMHSHRGLQEQQLMAAPLVVRSAEDLKRDAQEVVVLLHDFSFKEPAELLSKLGGGHAMHHGGMPADLNDVEYDAYLANDRTLNDPLVVRTERNGRVHLRLINGATTTAFWIGLGGATATVFAVDGNPVRPVSGARFPLAQGQRLDLLITMPKGGGSVPVLAQREGDRARTGIVLATANAPVARIASQADTVAGPIDLSLEQRLSAAAPPATAAAANTLKIALTGSMMPYAWGIAQHGPLSVKPGQRVTLEMTNRSPMAHAMHLHGHHFQIVVLNGKALAGALRDTVLVPIGASVKVAFDADNPGRWLLHCHHLLHMVTGMMTEIRYT